MSSSELSPYLHETESFGIIIASLNGKEFEGIPEGYALYNKRTGVREHETNSEHHAILMVHEAERLLQKAIMDPTQKAARAEREAALAQYQGWNVGDNDD